LEKEHYKNLESPSITRNTPIIIKAISFFIILGSVLAILFYGFIFIFRPEILVEEISIISNPFVSTTVYILIEIIVFILLIVGASLLLYLKRWGIHIIMLTMAIIITMNYAYFVQVNWFYLSVLAIILLILIINWKKFK